MTKSIITTAMLSSFLLIGCGSDNASSTSNTFAPVSENANESASGTEQGKRIKKGYYVDAPVQGILFQCGNQQGFTDVNGTFTFEGNATCTFSIGDLVLREVNATFLEDNVTILEDNITVAQLLQNLDADGNASNGILIESGTASVLKENNILDIPTDTDILTLIRDDLRANNPDYNGTAVSKEEAETHLNETKERLNNEGRRTQHDVNNTREEGKESNFDNNGMRGNETHENGTQPSFENNETRENETRENETRENETHENGTQPSFENNETRGNEAHENGTQPSFENNETRGNEAHENGTQPSFENNETRGNEAHENGDRESSDENRTRPEGRLPRG